MVFADTSLAVRLALLKELWFRLEAGWAEEASNKARRGTNILTRSADFIAWLCTRRTFQQRRLSAILAVLEQLAFPSSLSTRFGVATWAADDCLRRECLRRNRKASSVHRHTKSSHCRYEWKTVVVIDL